MAKKRADTLTYSRPNAADLMRKMLLKQDGNLPLVLYELTSLPAFGNYIAKISSCRQNSLCKKVKSEGQERRKKQDFDQNKIQL